MTLPGLLAVRDRAHVSTGYCDCCIGRASLSLADMFPVYVYVLASRHHRHLSVGVTANLALGIRSHRIATQRRLGRPFVLQKLVYVEVMYSVDDALQREEVLLRLGMNRLRRVVSRVNPNWDSISLRALQQAGFMR